MQFLCCLHLSGISKNQARDETKKKLTVNPLGSVYSEGIPRNPKTCHMQEHMGELISWNYFMARFTTFDDKAREVKESYDCFLFAEKKARYDNNGCN